MSAKNCQLCGKPLGRMRVGSDGDFCSREHRNQFRLRKGMDRLQEANKVASLMRRRENPKQMPVAQLLSSPVMERRGALKMARFAERHVQTRFPVSRPSLFRSRIPVAGRPLPGLRGRSLPAELREMTPPALLSSARVSPKPALPVRTIQESVACLPQGSMARLRFPVRGPLDAARECGAVLGVSRRPSLRAFENELGTVGPRYIDRIRRLQDVVKARNSAATHQMPAALTFVRRIPSLHGAHRSVSLAPGLSGGCESQFVPLESSDFADITVHALPCAAPIPEHVLRLPGLDYRVSADLAAQPRFLSLAGTADLGSAARQIDGGPWHAQAPASATWLPSVALADAALARCSPLRGSGALALAEETYRLAEVPFTPADWTFDHKPIALQGHLTAPRAEPAPPPGPLLEEDFNSGMSRWIGETADWRLDAAGARPAGLALFQPSLALIDYDLEFLARIEKHGLTFVFRASNPSNYHKVTIGLAESGRYELRRSVVIGGVEESAIVSPLGETPRPGSAFTVKTSARRNDFAISLEGEVVVHWTDGRLPAGAIGFTALRGDRARIYWVRLAPLGGPNSEAAPRRLPRSIQ